MCFCPLSKLHMKLLQDIFFYIVALYKIYGKIEASNFFVQCLYMNWHLSYIEINLSTKEWCKSKKYQYIEICFIIYHLWHQIFLIDNISTCSILILWIFIKFVHFKANLRLGNKQTPPPPQKKKPSLFTIKIN